MSKCAAVMIAAVALAAASVWVLPAYAAGGFVVVVNASNPTTSLSRSQVSNLFLRKTPSWSHGQKVQPVDLSASNPIRGKFSVAIHRKSVGAIKAYWSQRLFEGKIVPPPELSTEGAIAAYLRDNRGAVGYLSASASLGGLKIVQVTN